MMKDWKRIAERAEARCEDLETQLEILVSRIGVMSRHISKLSPVTKTLYDVSIDSTSILTVEAVNEEEAEKIVKAMHSSEIDEHIRVFGTIAIAECVEISND